MEVKGTISIEWLSDSHECDTCGFSHSEGAAVQLDGVEILRFEPVAHCFGGDHWEAEEIYRAVLVHLGYRVETDHDNIFASTDAEETP